VSDTIKFTPSPAFDRAAQALDIGVESFWFNQYPAEQAGKLEARIKMAAKLLGKATGLSAQPGAGRRGAGSALSGWHHLSAHLGRASEFKPGPLPPGWLDALSAATLLTVVPEDDVTLACSPARCLRSLRRRRWPCSLTRQSRSVLDAVSAALVRRKVVAGRSATEVR
jgi:hypothetical protein